MFWVLATHGLFCDGLVSWTKLWCIFVYHKPSSQYSTKRWGRKWIIKRVRTAYATPIELNTAKSNKMQQSINKYIAEQ